MPQWYFISVSISLDFLFRQLSVDRRRARRRQWCVFRSTRFAILYKCAKFDRRPINGVALNWSDPFLLVMQCTCFVRSIHSTWYEVGFRTVVVVCANQIIAFVCISLHSFGAKRRGNRMESLEREPKSSRQDNELFFFIFTYGGVCHRRGRNTKGATLVIAVEEKTKQYDCLCQPYHRQVENFVFMKKEKR